MHQAHSNLERIYVYIMTRIYAYTLILTLLAREQILCDGISIIPSSHPHQILIRDAVLFLCPSTVIIFCMEEK